ncbi:DUF3365 domain-containing protein [Haliea sp.]|uniref:c-type heme family protein n=1 Tax=Haliea sp. TaxID=1932666 RepID=UPI003529B537
MRLCVMVFLGACVVPLASAAQNTVEVAGRSADAALDQARLTAGFQALESACFSCHSPDASAGNRVAPPMAAIKKHYIQPGTSYKAFRDRLVSFVQDPSAENARMPGAIDRFGLMPKMPFDQVMVEEIAYYIYHSALEAPGWFEQHFQAEQQQRRRLGQSTLVTDADYLRRGREVAMRAKSTLGSSLKQAISAGGPVAAIDFCHDNAIPLTEGAAAEQGVAVRRVSDRPRNPANAATAAELAYMATARSALAAGTEPAPAVQRVKHEVVAYYPIVTNGLCLQCHGRPGVELQAETQAALRARYPDDQAVGYGVNELRGIFVVSMPAQ